MTDDTTRRNLLRTLILGSAAALALSAPTPAQTEPSESLDGGTP